MTEVHIILWNKNLFHIVSPPIKLLNKRLLICKISPFIRRTRANGAHYDDYV